MTRRGFTLVEVLVALVLSGAVLLTGAAAFGAAVDGLGSAERVVHDELITANRRGWLERTLRSLEVGLPGGIPFAGTPARISFSTRIQSADGWWETRAAMLSQEGDALIAQLDGGEPLILARGLDSARFDYLIKPGLDTRWTGRWQSPVSAPLAIRIRLMPHDSTVPADTLVLFIGERG